MSEELSQRIESRIDRAETSAMEVTDGALSFANAGQLMEFAKLMAIANIGVPKHLRNSPGACLAVVMQASEWKMSPFAVANKSYSVNDRLAYEAQLVNAVILQRAPIRGRFKVTYEGEDNNRTCTVSATLTDGEEVSYTSPPIGKIPVKNSPLWKSDPDQQLFYFSSRSMCRRHFPDVLLGIYTPDELDNTRTERQARGAVVLETALDPMALPSPVEPEPMAAEEAERKGGGQ